MAKIQNPENQKGEKLATEINVSESLKNLSEEIHSLEYIVSSITNETMPVTFGLDINVSTNLENVNLEGEEKQLTDAKAAKAYTDKALETAKAYTDEKVEEETTRATEREDSIEVALNAEIERATTRENAIENSFNNHADDTIKHFKEGEHEQVFSANSLLYSSNKNILSEDGGTYYGIQFTPEEKLTINKISILRRDSSASGITSKYLAIFTNDKNFITISKGVAGTIVDDICNWEFDNISLEAGITYKFIFPNSESNSFSSATQVNLRALEVSEKTNLSFISNTNGDLDSSSYVPSIAIYGEGRLFATIDEVAPHISNNIIHLTPDEKETVISLKSANINNLYDRADNITSVSNNTITFSDGNTAVLEPESIISAQYAFRAANTTSSQLTEFNKRTVYAHIDGTIETATGVDNASQSSATQHCRYEQDLVDQDDEVTQSLSTLINGTGMFVRSKLTLFNDDLTCLTNGKSMFASNYELTEFKSPLPSLVYAKGMFTGCRKLTKWRVKLPSLVIGNNMFSSIANDPANYMQLAEVDTCLPNLTIARQMFYRCYNLTKFHVPSTSFSNLYDAQEMFQFTKITSINGNFESLENGERMFADGPTLDAASVQNIAETIRDWSEGYPGMTDDARPIISLGNIDTSNDDILNALNKIVEKGWDVEPDPSQIATLDSNTIGFFARVSYTLSNKTHIDENGNQCSLILVPTLQWIMNKNVWSPMVSSIEEAETYFNLSKIETPEEPV